VTQHNNISPTPRRSGEAFSGTETGPAFFVEKNRQRICLPFFYEHNMCGKNQFYVRSFENCLIIQ